MDKNILAGRALDETIALGIVEPLNYTLFSHYKFSLELQPEPAEQVRRLTTDEGNRQEHSPRRRGPA
jgi:hypothetical protein